MQSKSPKTPSDLINLNNIHLNIVNSCGYCSSKKTWVTSGFSCPKMSCDTYQVLLEKGWRRCGMYYYKPELSKCCCRPYPIRLETQKYRFRGSHLQSLRKFGNFIRKKPDTGTINPDPPESDQQVQQLLHELFEEIRTRFKLNGKNMDFLKNEHKEKLKINTPSLKSKKFQKTTNLMWVVYTANEAIMKAENMEFKCFRELIAEFIMEYMKQRNSNYVLICHQSGYITIHLKEKQQAKKINTQEVIEGILIDPTTEFEIQVVPATFEEESYEIYRKYSQTIHNISESKGSYESFLCQQALQYMDFGEDDSMNGLRYGCFHMKYYYEKKLIAVGVIDVLPKGLSSVYFFYDPQFKRNSLGVIGSLREIALTQNLNNFLPKFQYYYMGYYIQNSKKMKYKGDFEPSELLCPKAFKWVPLNEKMKTLIKENREDVGLCEEIIVPEGKKSECLAKEYFIGKKKMFFFDEWIGLGELQSKYINHFIENMIGLGKVLGKEVLDRMEFTMT